MAVNFFTPATYATMVAKSTSTNIVAPAGATLRLTNIGSNLIAVLMGAAGVVVTAATGLVIQPGESIYIASGGLANIAAITVGGGPSSSALYIAGGA